MILDQTLLRINHSKIRMKRLLSLIICLYIATAISKEDNAVDLMSLSLQELLELRIESAGKKPERIKDIPASVVIISREEIRAYGYRSLSDILEHVSGLYNIYNYSGVPGNFGIRGFWNPRSQNSNVAILVNGINQAREDIRSNPFAKITIPPEVIDRIEIIRGPMSVIYGNGASFGVINIVTTDERSDTDSINFSMGTGDSRKVTFSHRKIDDNYRWVLNLGLNSSDPIDAKLVDMIDPNKIPGLTGLGITDPENYNFEGLLEQQYKYLESSHEYRDWEFDFSYNQSKFDKYIIFPPVDEGTIEDTRNYMLHIGHNRPIFSDSELKLDLTTNDFRRTQDFDALTPDLVGFNRVEYKSFEFEAIVNTHFSEQHELMTGFDYRLLSDSFEFTHAPLVGFINESVSIENRETSAIFAQSTYHFSEHLSMVTGFRYEKISKHDRIGIQNGGTPQEDTFGGPQGGQTNHTPRVALVYQPKRNHTFKAMYGEASKMVTDRFDAEKTKTVELSYLFSKSDNLTEISLFKNQLEDLVVDILEVNPDGSVTNSTLQAGNQETLGLELRTQYHFSSRLSGEINLTLQSSEDKLLPQIDVAYSPETVINSKLRYNTENSVFSLLFKHVSEIDSFYDVSVDNGDGTFGSRIGDSVESYTLVDFNFRYDELWPNTDINFKINNLFDSTIRYPNNQTTAEFLDRGTIGFPRRILVNLTYRF